ncbi:MAG: hypothetical protein DRJ10_08750 [Bacteroidetes bacterium]|nr:MAG: hypothetical protein DRJ10_08750 [Bacteroidota bacterium]
MIKKIFSVILVGLFAASFVGCGGKDPDEVDFGDANDFQEDVQQIDENAINGILESFSSPVEMAALIEDLGVPFSKKYLASPEVADDYDTNFKKAIGLGVLSADLGYLNVYAKTGEIVNYLAVIKGIADELNIGQFFDFQTLKRLATNNDNMDSLMFLSVNSFHQMDEHLRKNNRSNLSALVVTGVWMEGLYLATQIAKDDSNKSLRDRVGEQQMILTDLFKILEVYQTQDKNFEKLVKDFQELNKAYEHVSITFVDGVTETVEIDGITVVIQKDSSIVEMSDEQLSNIISVTEKIRNKLISL